MAEVNNTANIEMPQNGAQSESNATPAANGGKTFTQDDVNRIVSERLARERAAKPGEDPLAEREAELNKRENVLKCKEYIDGNKDFAPQLMELFDTSDFENFKSSVEKLHKLFPTLFTPTEPVRVSSGSPFNFPRHRGSDESSSLNSIFLGK